MGKFYQCIQSYGPSFMTKFCSALYLENLLTNIFAKLNLRGGVSCMPAVLLFHFISTFKYLFPAVIVRGRPQKETVPAEMLVTQEPPTHRSGRS